MQSPRLRLSRIVSDFVLTLAGLGFMTVSVFALPETPDETAISRIDRLYTQRAELKNNQAALSQCETALQNDPENVPLAWRASRAAWWVGTQLEDRSARLRYFKKGISFAEKALAREPNSVEAHFWLGGNFSSYGNAKGTFTSLKLIHSIRQEMEEVRKRDPRYMGGGADRILGILDYKVPGLMGGNKKRALEHLEQSLRYDARNPVTLFYLADFYAAEGNKIKAREYLSRLNTVSPSEDFAPEWPLMQLQGKTLASRIGD